MTFAMIGFNISGLLYNVFISNTLGAETIGLFHLVGSVYSIGISLCVSGMSLTATRLLSDMPREKGLMCSDSILSKCLAISLVTSLVATLVLYGFSDIIATSILGRSEASRYLKILSLCLVAVSVSSVLGGYFTAFGKVGAICMGRLLSEGAVWGATFFFLKTAKKGDECMAIVKATMLSAFVQCFCDLFFWRVSGKGQMKQRAKVSYGQVVRLCAPLALGSYLRTFLSSAENLLIPKRLSRLSPDALSEYGVLKGMTMPVLFFPSVLTGAFISLLVPEIARRFSQNHKKSVEYVSKLSLGHIIKFGFCVSAVFFFWSDDISKEIFNRSDAGEYLHFLALLPLFMYADSVTDAVLKGANEQVFSLKVNTVDAIARVFLVFFFVPVFGIRAYIVILYVSEIFNLALSFMRLKKITALHFSFCRAVMSALFCVACAYLFICFLKPQSLIVQILTFVGAYVGISELSQAFCGKWISSFYNMIG